MVKIRLSPKGRKGQRSFWIIAIEAKKARDSGNYLKHLGFWNPRTKEVKLDKDSINDFLKHGAQPTETVGNLFKKHL